MFAPGHPLVQRTVPILKVRRYLLDLGNPEGQSKARFFIRFGFTPSDPARLAAALHDHPESNPITDTWSDPWGIRFEVLGPIVSPDGRNPTILTAWINDGGGPTRLVTAVPA